MTKIAEIAQKVTELATEFAKQKKKTDELKTATEGALDSFAKLLQNLPSPQDIANFRDELKNFSKSEECRTIIKQLVKEELNEKTKALEQRISQLEKKLRRQDDAKYAKMLILSNIKRAHQLPAREAVLSSLPDNFKVVNFEASYMGKDLILLDFPHNTGKYNFKIMLQENKVGSLLKIYCNDFIPKHMQGEKNKLSKFAKELKDKKKIQNWEITLNPIQGIILKVATKNSQSNKKTWHKTNKCEEGSFFPKLPTTTEDVNEVIEIDIPEIPKIIVSGSPTNKDETNSDDRTKTPVQQTHGGAKRVLPTPEKEENRGNSKRRSEDTSSTDDEMKGLDYGQDRELSDNEY